MGYKVGYSDKALKRLKKMDRRDSGMLLGWIEKNLIDISDPYSKGKALVGNKKGQWRYRIGDYRLLCKIENDELLILVIEIGHRKDVYN